MVFYYSPFSTSSTIFFTSQSYLLLLLLLLHEYHKEPYCLSSWSCSKARHILSTQHRRRCAYKTSQCWFFFFQSCQSQYCFQSSSMLSLLCQVRPSIQTKRTVRLYNNNHNNRLSSLVIRFTDISIQTVWQKCTKFVFISVPNVRIRLVKREI